MTRSKVIDPSKMTHAQQKFLLDELTKMSWYKIKGPTRAVPKKVAHAERAILRLRRVRDAHHKKELSRRARLQKQYDRLVQAAHKQIYFGTPQQAQAAIDAVARWCERYSAGKLR